MLVLDNARIHHYSRVANLKNELGIELLYLPPYSPFLNPIENGFSKWKNSVLRGAARNESEFFELISSGFSCITSEDCDGWYRKMLGYVIRCSNNEVINE